MKTVFMLRTYDYRPHPARAVRFLEGVTYSHVLEAAAREIEREGAGRIVYAHEEMTIDAGPVFRPGKRGG
jgi:hypothetical protein